MVVSLCTSDFLSITCNQLHDYFFLNNSFGELF
uniref:Uncharacterized protein n=1 Tax=Rhizophora mucronata TaxID=61149 RepID=A0A2P2NJW4_RHIMU